MKSSKRGSTPARSKCLRRKTLSTIIVGFVVFLLCNYVVLFSRLSSPSESVDNGMTFGHSSSEKSTNTWKKMMRNETSKLGIHVLRPETPITNIIVLGERHSGTTFFTKYLSNCFPNINVGDNFVNNKHWIQYDPDYLFRTVSENSPSTPSLWWDISKHNYRSDESGHGSSNNYFQNSLVLVLFRNPYDWVEAMRRKPWHWPNHINLFPLSGETEPLNIKGQTRKQRNGSTSGGLSIEKSFVGHNLLDWKDFAHRPLYLKEEETAAKLCQMGYPSSTVSPCLANANYVPEPLSSIPKSFLRHLPFDTNNPIYEHDPIDRKPFENLLQLRAFKVKNFLSLPEQWELAGIGFLQYDSLLGKGLKSLTKEVSSTLRIRSSCPALEPFEKAPYNLTDDFKDWITKEVQWDVEKFVGYYERGA